jgi:hypothetical protein
VLVTDLYGTYNAHEKHEKNRIKNTSEYVYYQVMYEFQGGIGDRERNCDWHRDPEGGDKFVRYEHFRERKGHVTIQLEKGLKGVKIRRV